MIAGNKNKKPKLYNSFLLSFLAAAFLPLILAGVLLYWPLTSELRNNAESNSQKIATSVRTMIYQFMGEYDAVIKTIERFQDTAALDDAEMETVLSGFLSTYPAIRAIEFADKSGKIVFSIPASNHLVGTDISRQGYYSLYSQFTSTIWSDIVIPQNQSTPLIIAAKKTKSGGILISLSISNLSGMVQELGGGKEYLIFITDSRGNLVLHPDIEQVLKQQNYKDLKSVQDAMRGKEGFRQERIDSEDFAVSTKLIGSANWVIVAGSPVTFAYKSLFVFYQTYVISFLAAFIIASVISILRFRKFSASLVALDKATGQFADPNGSEGV
jgi:methyl-accepting chemotaxis protein